MEVLEMDIDKKLRDGVIQALPEAEQIKNQELREKVYDAWAVSLATSGFKKIEDIPASGNPGTPVMKTGTQADHLRSVARLSAAIARELAETFPQFDVDMDEVIAGGLCHDLGKPFEFDAANQERWKSDPRITGWPSIRHPVYGVHIALSVGLPEKLAHIAGAHSMEGENVKRSLVATVINYADYAYWRILEAAGVLKT
jgi:putative nucleotidyltransferase with HDIG domain